MKNFKFNKQVDVRFNMKKLPGYDQHYLKQMVYSIVHESTNGVSFSNKYPQAASFSLLANDQQINEFKNKYGRSAGVEIRKSHMLTGRKQYYFAWTYSN